MAYAIWVADGSCLRFCRCMLLTMNLQARQRSPYKDCFVMVVLVHAVACDSVPIVRLVNAGFANGDWLTCLVACQAAAVLTDGHLPGLP